MEGIGSRTGRPSSRYGSAPVFTGPVRRWQKQWIHVSSSSSSSSSVSYSHGNNFNSSGGNNNSSSNNVSAVRIRRWTPVPAAESGGESESAAEERPRRRKLRYAPIVVLEGKRKEVEKADPDVKEASKTNQPIAQGTSENDDDEKMSSDKVLPAKSQASEKSATEDLNKHPMDLDIGLDNDSNKVADWVKTAQKGFAR
ncbi:hypothetical protein OSB04_015466 [Centaurea solstitialis]|uniref:Uncharacterized protein n=1 Tax=Centaurea solstitialis TaxID=347529 RepID=A0AA38WK66_9ASTR|nr:hypothetical protein OSB04_015466 [Centaurea solstitialis]